MPIPLIWSITVAFGFLFWSVVAAQYIWPAIGKRERAEALRPILVLHGFRYIGMIFLVPGVVSAEIADTVFARGVAYGDLLTATLAFIALAALRSRFAEPLVWLFNHLARQRAGRAGRGLFHPHLWSVAVAGDACARLPAADAQAGRCARECYGRAA
jgi:hypothetical protein